MVEWFKCDNCVIFSKFSEFQTILRLFRQIFNICFVELLNIVEALSNTTFEYTICDRFVSYLLLPAFIYSVVYAEHNQPVTATPCFHSTQY